MTDQETNLLNAFETTLTAEMGDTALTASVVTTTGLSSPCYLVIDPDDASKREYILFDGTFTGTTFVASAIGNRYLTGSAAGSGITHALGAVVRMVPMAQHFEDLNDRVDVNEVDVSTLSTWRASHEGSTDSSQHPEATTSLRGFMSAADKTSLDGLSGHAGGTDTADHPEATTSVRGFMSATDKTKLDGIEPSATADQSGAEILAALLPVDGATSGLDADLLDGADSESYLEVGDSIVWVQADWDTNFVANNTTYELARSTSGLNVPTSWAGYVTEVIVTGTLQKDSGTPTADNIDLRLMVENQSSVNTEILEYTNLLANASTERIPFAMQALYTTIIDPSVNGSQIATLWAKTSDTNTINIREVCIICKAYRVANP